MSPQPEALVKKSHKLAVARHAPPVASPARLGLDVGHEKLPADDCCRGQDDERHINWQSFPVSARRGNNKTSKDRKAKLVMFSTAAAF